MSEMNTTSKTEKATFGAGCFWQVEAAYQETPGVIETAVGYEGGHVDNPTTSRSAQEPPGTLR